MTEKELVERVLQSLDTDLRDPRNRIALHEARLELFHRGIFMARIELDSFGKPVIRQLEGWRT